MNKGWYIGLFGFSLLIMLGIGWLETSPGYMDADYYYASGLRISIDKSWTEPFIWNYLAEPDSLPQPAFTYWMPLAGVISALGITLMGNGDFWSARIFFFLIAACISPLTAFMAYTFTPKKWAALLAGALGIFSGFYLVFLTTTDTFAVYMLLGGIAFLIIRKFQRDLSNRDHKREDRGQDNSLRFRTISPLWVYAAAGCTSGLMFMTRADGLIWLLMILSAIGMQLRYYQAQQTNGEKVLSRSGYWLPFMICMGVFLLVSSPWMMRNWGIFGTIFAPGSSRALWLTRYDELFAFPASQLTASRWINQGIGPILSARTWALGLNAGTALAVQGSIFLLPFSIAGLWRWRKDWRIQIGVTGWILVFLAMTLIFPFQGARGGFFHAGSGFQILIWALVPAGLVEFVEWGQRRRNWTPDSAVVKFGIGMVVLMVLVTGFLSWQRLYGSPGSGDAWGEKAQAYEQVEAYLKGSNNSAEQIVMINNPPGYYAVTGRQAIVIPDGDMEALLGAAEVYKARYLVIDKDFSQGLEALYREPRDYPGIAYLESISDMNIYQVEP